MDSSIFLSITGYTSTLVIAALISSSKFLLKNISGDANKFSPGSASKA